MEHKVDCDSLAIRLIVVMDVVSQIATELNKPRYNKAAVIDLQQSLERHNKQIFEKYGKLVAKDL